MISIGQLKEFPFRNISWLSLATIFNYLLPLITIPYVVRIIGVELFGVVSLALSIMSYCVIVVDFGFNLTATQEIAQNKSNKKATDKIFWSVFFVKFGLLIIVSISLSFIIYFIPDLKKYATVYFYSFIMVVANVFYPIWYFQGMENMRTVSLLGIISRIISVILIILFLKEKTQFYLYPLFLSVSQLIVSMYSMVYLIKSYKVNFTFPSRIDIWLQIHNGFTIFITSLTVSLYTSSTVIILGIFTNTYITGLFSGIERIVQSLKGLFNPISQAMYPYLATKFQTQQELARKQILQLGMSTLIIFGIISLIVFIFANQLTTMILGEEFTEAYKILKILSPLILIVPIGNIFGIQGLLNLGQKKLFTKTVVLTGILGIVAFIIATINYQAIGLSFTILTTELILTIILILTYIKKAYEDSNFSWRSWN